jgi:hypothetical protein
MKTVLCLLICASSTLASPIIDLGIDTLKFGHISAGGNQIRQLVIGNAGDEPLSINYVTFHDSTFALISPVLPDTIAVGMQGVFEISFLPLDEISYDRDLYFHSNDPGNPDAHLPVIATGAQVFMPGEIIWSYQGIENVVSSVAADDIDGDGIQEVIVESFDAGAQGDNLLCLSGSGSGPGELIWSARPLGGPSNSGGYGDQCLITIDDMNGNGTQDLILGTAWGSRSIFAIEGTTGDSIWSYDTYQNPPSGWIYSVASMGDIDGDGIPEVLAGAGSDANAAYCLNGADGSLRWKRVASDVIYSVCRIDDVNGDAIPEAVLGAGDYDDMIYCVSGAGIDTTQTLWTYDTNGGSVLSIAKIKDISIDGYDDIIAGTWYNGHRVIALSGYSADGFGDVVWNVVVGQPIVKVVVSPDLDGDGFEDVLVASWASYALALSGVDGHEIWRCPGGDDVWAIHWAYDVTGDSVCEVVAGSFTGDVILIDGASGQALWTCPTEAKIFTVRPIDDVNGDGKKDIIAGQQMLQNSGGRFFVISGGTVEPVGIEDEEIIVPENYLLLTNYPNPFNGRTAISYSLPRASHVRLEVFNLLGQRVATLIDGYREYGEHKIIWNTSDDDASVSSGIYYGRLIVGDEVALRKMTLLK